MSEERLMTKIKRLFNKNEWSVRLLGLSRSEIPKDKPGLIMIQIDGFSKNQFEEAIKNGEMPFLKRLLHTEKYQLYSHYPGLPAATPSVQGELFYGVKQIIPAFSFFDRSSESVFTMFKGVDASDIEKRLRHNNEGLLKGGSSYSNVFSGGADEYHFCAVNLKWFELLKNARPIKKILFFLLHAVEMVSIIVLMIWETLISCVDFISGFRLGHELFKELKFIPTRSLFCILLRELITIGVKIDISRGFPIIHANFIGYDEQAHRRGPSSRFAHWTLKGIDGAIDRIYRESLNTASRHYDVWIYSDHGQEDVVSYYSAHNQTIQSKVAEVFEELKPSFKGDDAVRGIQHQRLRYFNNRFLNRFILKKKEAQDTNSDLNWVVTAIGPTGNIYSPIELSCAQKCLFAEKLVKQGHVPIVAVNERINGAISVWTEKGKFQLPDDAQKIFGEHNQFIKDITDDFIKLTQHTNAGDFTICGWRPNQKPYSFALENGSHAGPGSNETNAFALLPCDVLSVKDDRDYIKTHDLRQAALAYLNRTAQTQKTVRTDAKNESKIRIMTYNVHSCVGMDGHLSPERIARVIARHEPDIIALQEMDMHKVRSENIDQPHMIANYLNMYYHFHPSIQIQEEKYGNAILSRFPLKVVFAGTLPLSNRRSAEERGALWVKVNIDGIDWNVINTHLGLDRSERLAQIRSLIGSQWLAHADCYGPTILCGDLNAFPHSRVCKTIKTVLKDASANKRLKTWPSRRGIVQIDHIFVSRDFDILNIQVSKTDLDRTASDHLPLIADLKSS